MFAASQQSTPQLNQWAVASLSNSVRKALTEKFRCVENTSVRITSV